MAAPSSSPVRRAPAAAQRSAGVRRGRSQAEAGRSDAQNTPVRAL